MRRLIVGMLVAGAVAAGLAGSAAAQSDLVAWSRVGGPSSGPAQAIGGYAAGCIAGAQPLPGEGTGFQVIRMSRQRYYGHPELVGYLRDFGRKVAAAGLGTALIGDMGQARGGPMSFGHASHQSGLDADVWLRLDLPPVSRKGRESLTEIKYVDYARMRVTADWSERHAQLVRIAAGDPRVARVFVNPAIKLAMCRNSWPDRAFLRKLRPWHGHDGHMHVRLRCPAGSPQCEEQAALPEGDGCGEELDSWLDSAAPAVERPAAKPRPRAVTLPPACKAVLRATGTRVAAAERTAAPAAR